MTRFEQDAAVAKQRIIELCIHMSATYLAPVLNDAELMLVSRHQADNVATRHIVDILTPMASGSALQIIREVRAALLPIYQSKNLTIRGLSPVFFGFDEGHAFATQEVKLLTCDQMRFWFASYGEA